MIRDILQEAISLISNSHMLHIIYTLHFIYTHKRKCGLLKSDVLRQAGNNCRTKMIFQAESHEIKRNYGSEIKRNYGSNCSENYFLRVSDSTLTDACRLHLWI